jgi:hypothetical protein
MTTVLQGFFCLTLAACGGSGAVRHDDVPATLRAPEGQELVLTTHAVGVQIYVCQAAKDDPSHLEWAFKAPEADLKGSGGRSVGKHYAGPSWEAKDGSKVIGSPVAKESPDPKSIPWLLLTAKTTSGKGIFSDVHSIQRLRTVGGMAPAGGCGQPMLGQEMRVSYTADYLFFR